MTSPHSESDGKPGPERAVFPSVGTRLASVATVLLVGLLAIGAVTAPVAAGSQAGTVEATTTHILAINTDGSADVTLQLSYDLDSESERAAFASLRADQATKTAMAGTFTDRLRGVAAAVSDRTGRSVSVSDAEVSVTTTADGTVGIVSIAATWTGLATVTNDRVTVTEPYASGFVAENRFVVRPPEGYRVVETSPPPSQTLEDGVSWAAGTDLDGFRLVAAPTGTGSAQSPADAGTSGTTGPGQPGFGLAIGALGILGGLGLRRYSGRR